MTPPAPPAATNHQARVIAEAAWRHLLNRHALAALVDQLAATEPQPSDPLAAAIDHLVFRPAEAHPSTTQPGEPQQP